MKKETKIKKDNYQLAKECVASMPSFRPADIEVENIKVFRKYLYELAFRSGKTFISKKNGDSVIVTRIK